MNQEALELAQKLIEHPRWEHDASLDASYITPKNPSVMVRFEAQHIPISYRDHHRREEIRAQWADYKFVDFIRRCGAVPNLSRPEVWGWLIAWILAEGGAVEMEAGQYHEDYEQGAHLARQLLELWGTDQ